MSVDNDVFDQDAELWWSDNSHCALLSSIVPARIEYLRRVFTEILQKPLRGATVLDIGCGGGLFAEEVAKLGCEVIGVDPSTRSIEIAREHAEQMGLSLTYHVAFGERLPFDDNTFDMVYCCDVLEHVHDVSAVISESARVLKTGGMYLFDTINRTWLSKFLMITLIQDWLGIVPRNLHDWKAFIKPQELKQLMRRHGLDPRDITGLVPRIDPLTNIKRLFDIRKLKRGEITYAAFGRGMVFRMQRFTSLNYIGYALKPPHNF
jgi:2-polyprenyl-6-hydroxyphenyl methylase/3-demethylubiquinone-9 3-methyltransferase